MVFISCLTNDTRFIWEVEVLLHSLRKWGYSEGARMLVFSFDGKPFSGEFARINDKYPEAKFFFYPDEGNQISRLVQMFGYPAIFRPYILKKHWEDHPEMESTSFFYTDTDVIFRKPIDFDKFLKDDVCYLSDVKSYMNADYFQSKYMEVKDENGNLVPRFVHPKKFKQFKKRDILDECSHICGINKDVCIENNNNTGGAQYLLKNIKTEFWDDVFNSILSIKLYLSDINQTFMKGDTPQEKEDNGFQSFCADMWAIQWLLWAKGYKTQTPKELDFCWPTDLIENHQEGILHNAGVTSDAKIRTRQKDENLNPIWVDSPIFYKGNFLNQSPIHQKQLLTNIISHPLSSLYLTKEYIEEIIQALN